MTNTEVNVTEIHKQVHHAYFSPEALKELLLEQLGVSVYEWEGKIVSREVTFHESQDSTGRRSYHAHATITVDTAKRYGMPEAAPVPPDPPAYVPEHEVPDKGEFPEAPSSHDKLEPIF